MVRPRFRPVFLAAPALLVLVACLLFVLARYWSGEGRKTSNAVRPAKGESLPSHAGGSCRVPPPTDVDDKNETSEPDEMDDEPSLPDDEDEDDDGSAPYSDYATYSPTEYADMLREHSTGEIESLARETSFETIIDNILKSEHGPAKCTWWAVLGWKLDEDEEAVAVAAAWVLANLDTNLPYADVVASMLATSSLPSAWQHAIQILDTLCREKFSNMPDVWRTDTPWQSYWGPGAEFLKMARNLVCSLCNAKRLEGTSYLKAGAARWYWDGWRERDSLTSDGRPHFFPNKGDYFELSPQIAEALLARLQKFPPELRGVALFGLQGGQEQIFGVPYFLRGQERQFYPGLTDYLLKLYFNSQFTNIEEECLLLMALSRSRDPRVKDLAIALIADRRQQVWCPAAVALGLRVHDEHARAALWEGAWVRIDEENNSQYRDVLAALQNHVHAQAGFDTDYDSIAGGSWYFESMLHYQENRKRMDEIRKDPQQVEQIYQAHIKKLQELFTNGRRGPGSYNGHYYVLEEILSVSEWQKLLSPSTEPYATRYPENAAFMESLLSDPNEKIREKADFILKRWRAREEE